MSLEDLEQDLRKVIADMRQNFPQLGSDRFYVGDTDDIATGTQLTVTFTLNPEWITYLEKAYADSRTGCTYKWMIDGKLYELNEVSFTNGRIISGEQVSTIVLIIANTSGTTQTVGFFVKGWGDRREGL